MDLSANMALTIFKARIRNRVARCSLPAIGGLLACTLGLFCHACSGIITSEMSTRDALALRLNMLKKTIEFAQELQPRCMTSLTRWCHFHAMSAHQGCAGLAGRSGFSGQPLGWHHSLPQKSGVFPAHAGSLGTLVRNVIIGSSS